MTVNLCDGCKWHYQADGDCKDPTKPFTDFCFKHSNWVWNAVREVSEEHKGFVVDCKELGNLILAENENSNKAIFPKFEVNENEIS